MAPNLKALAGLPMPVRWGVVGYVLGAFMGGVVGLVVGLRTHAPTAWAAVFEVGLPSAVAAGLTGLICGSLFAGVRLLRSR